MHFPDKLPEESLAIRRSSRELGSDATVILSVSPGLDEEHDERVVRRFHDFAKPRLPRALNELGLTELAERVHSFSPDEYLRRSDIRNDERVWRALGFHQCPSYGCLSAVSSKAFNALLLRTGENLEGGDARRAVFCVLKRLSSLDKVYINVADTNILLQGNEHPTNVNALARFSHPSVRARIRSELPIAAHDAGLRDLAQLAAAMPERLMTSRDLALLADRKSLKLPPSTMPISEIELAPRIKETLGRFFFMLLNTFRRVRRWESPFPRME